LACGYILDARELAVLSMLESIFHKITQKHEIKLRESVEAPAWQGKINLKILKNLEKNIKYSANLVEHSTRKGQFHVLSNEMTLCH
jgi:hypothetical protein